MQKVINLVAAKSSVTTAGKDGEEGSAGKASQDAKEGPPYKR